MEQHPFERPGLIGRWQQRHALELRVGRAPHQHRGILRGEADQLRADRLVGAARHFRGARRHVDAVRARRLCGAIDDEQRRQTVTQVRRTERDDERRNGGDCRERDPVAAHRCAFDDAAALHGATLLDRLLDELLDQTRRMIRRAAVGGRLDGADDGGFERRIAFLEVHRHLRVGHAAAERPDESVHEQRDEDGDRDDAKRDNRGRAEAERLEARRREQ